MNPTLDMFLVFRAIQSLSRISHAYINEHIRGKTHKYITHIMSGKPKKQKAKRQLKHPWDHAQGFPSSSHTHGSNQGVAGEQRDCCLFTLPGVQEGWEEPTEVAEWLRRSELYLSDDWHSVCHPASWDRDSKVCHSRETEVCGVQRLHVSNCCKICSNHRGWRKRSSRRARGLVGVFFFVFSEQPEHRWRNNSEATLVKGGATATEQQWSPQCPRRAESSSAARWATDLACFNT